MNEFTDNFRELTQAELMAEIEAETHMEESENRLVEFSEVMGSSKRFLGVNVMPLTIGGLMLFDMVDSPFMDDEKNKFNPLDIAIACLIITKREEAIDLIPYYSRAVNIINSFNQKLEHGSMVEKAMACEGLVKITEKVAELESVFLSNMEQLNIESPQSASSIILEFLSDSTCGSIMFAKNSDGGSKKNY